MPDAHWGYGFPIGGVAAFDPEEGGVISAGGVGFDISCGVRTLLTGIGADAITTQRERLADALFQRIPAGVGSHGEISLTPKDMDAMLRGGAAWAVGRGWGEADDLTRTEDYGCVAGACPEFISAKAKERQKGEMGTLGSGNHYLEVQRVAAVFDEDAARTYGLKAGDAVVSIHCGSRGLGHQIGTEALREMALTAARSSATLTASTGCAGCADRIRDRPALPGRHARGNQLRACQPADPHPPRPQRLCRDPAAGAAQAPL
jgi:tRNA-splicing ligase RtcB